MVIIIGLFFFFLSICWLTCRLWAVLLEGKGKEWMWNYIRNFQLSERNFTFEGKYQHSRTALKLAHSVLWRKSDHGRLHTWTGHSKWLKNFIFHQRSVCVHMAQIAQAGFLRCWHHQWVPDGMWWKFWFGPFRPEVLTKMDGSFWPPLVSIATGIPLKPVGEKDINSCYKFVRPGSHRPLSKW